MILDLVLRGARRPGRGIRVTPLRRDDDFTRFDLSLRQPESDKILRPTVGTRHVDVAESSVVCRVENIVRM